MAASDYLPDLADTACVQRGVHRWEAVCRLCVWICIKAAANVVPVLLSIHRLYGISLWPWELIASKCTGCRTKRSYSRVYFPSSKGRGQMRIASNSTVSVAFAIAVFIGIPTLCQTVLVVQNLRAEREFNLKCNPAEAFRVFNESLLAKALSTRLQPQNLGRLVVQVPRPRWSESVENASLFKTTYNVMFQGDRIFSVKDVSVAPRSIFSSIGMEPRTFSRNCVAHMNHDLANLVFAR